MILERAGVAFGLDGGAGRCCGGEGSGVLFSDRCIGFLEARRAPRCAATAMMAAAAAVAAVVVVVVVGAAGAWIWRAFGGEECRERRRGARARARWWPGRVRRGCCGVARVSARERARARAFDRRRVVSGVGGTAGWLGGFVAGVVS